MNTVRPPVTALLVTVLLIIGSGCESKAPNAKGDQGQTSPAKPSDTAPVGIGRVGPKAGDCFTYTDADTNTTDTSVSCAVKHTAEVSHVLQLPDGLQPEKKAGKKRLDAIAADQCPEAQAYVGYRGILMGAIYSSWTAPTKVALAEGARWLACTVAAYTSPPTPKGKSFLRERTTPIKGALTTDTALLREGTVCRPSPTPGDTVACAKEKNQWLGLAYRPDPKPFISADHQRDFARSFCAAAAGVYASVGSRWYALWSTKPTDNFGQNCLIPLKSFRPDVNPVLLGRSQPKLETPTGGQFAAKMNTVGKRLATQTHLMSEQAVQDRNFRASRNYYSTAVQNRTLCAVLSCTGAFSAGIDIEGNTTKFTATVRFQGESCRGKVVFPLIYLGAPFTVEDVDCA